jgi:hypothetical protein
MLATQQIGSFLTACLIFSISAFAGSVVLLTGQHLARRGRPWSDTSAVVAVCGASAAGAWWLVGNRWLIVLPLLVASVYVSAGKLFRSFTTVGKLLLTGNALVGLFGSLWGLWFVMTIPVSGITRSFMGLSWLLLTLTSPIRIMENFEQWEAICRRQWSRPRTPPDQESPTSYPGISVHVPICSEPPEVVVGTLNALAQLTYPNFEVIVVDNNTPNASLWRPVEEHCQRLGDRFRFYHLESCPGAKPCALNFALAQTSPAATLIALVDSDYQADRSFASALVGFFDDPRIAFVQTPHDYRDWEGSRYQRLCYWEYRRFNVLTQVSRNERSACINAGTMCLLRRKAVEEAGGWAEWSLTEDSELTLRLYALGYSSVYVPVTFGRGLIPTAFADYKRQRFRWTYGPVQLTKRHFPLLLPRPLGQTSGLSRVQKLHLLHDGFGAIGGGSSNGLGFLLGPLGMAMIVSMLAHHEVVAVPAALWAAVVIVPLSHLVVMLLAHRVVLGCSVRDTFGAVMAANSLGHTVAAAWFSALLGRRSRWARTSKFKAVPKGIATLGAARAELFLGTATLAAVATALVFFRPSGLLLLFLLLSLGRGVSYFAAPTMALMAEREAQASSAQAHLPERVGSGGSTNEGRVFDART